MYVNDTVIFEDTGEGVPKRLIGVLESTARNV